MNVLRLLNPERRARESRVRIDVEFYLPVEVTGDDLGHVQRRIENALAAASVMDGLDVRVTGENRCEHKRWAESCIDCQANRDQTLIAHELGLLA